MHTAISRGEYATVHNRATRNRDMAQSVFHGLTLTQHAVSYMGPKEWNKLPISIRSIEKNNIFKKALKAHLLNLYNSEPQLQNE